MFILTGFANPPENVKLHSSAGRFTVVQMETMTWQELGHSSGTVKLSDLLLGELNDFHEPPKSLNIITRTGMSYSRPDGINVISLASLWK